LNQYSENDTADSVRLHFSEYSTGWESNLEAGLRDLGFNASSAVRPWP
jgi:hypothetical protein